MKNLKQALTSLWCLPQNLIGFLVLLYCKATKKIVGTYKGSYLWDTADGGSISLGEFRFLSYSTNEEYLEKIHLHEYGHTLQSHILGPLYLFVIGIPSILWCNLPVCVNYRKKNKVSYYSFYTEAWANKLSGSDLK